MIKKVNKRRIRFLEFILVDSAIILFVYWFGMLFFNETNLFKHQYWYLIFVIIFIKLVIQWSLNLYNLLLDFVGFSEVVRVVISTFISNVLIYLTLLIIDRTFIPYYIFVYVFSLEIFLFSALRFSKRVLISLGIIYGHPRVKSKELINTLVIGAGSGGKLVLDEIHKNLNFNNKIMAFLDDDYEKIHKRLNGIPILGPISNAKTYIEKYDIEEIIIAIASIDPIRLQEIIKIFEKFNVKVKRLPLMTEINSDDDRKIIDVKIDDLLSRGVIDLDNQGLNDFIYGKTVLVTGGGGSIGSELCKQIISYNPDQLIIFDIYENTTYDVQIDLLRKIEYDKLDTHLVVLIGSVYNYQRMEDVFKKYQPQLVFHAAAYKHVPLMEDSAVEAVRTNVIGTYNVAKLSNIYGVEKMVLVSTDKAVRPTNIMGATKSCCEKIIQYFSTVSKTNYSAVRFGNVLGSHGSVVPLFTKQIKNGGPITITDRKITRYFMTIAEAVSLILQSGVYAQGGEIFILDMGEPVKIYDLAERMIKLCGLIPHIDIKIVEVGLRPGEKLYEELLLDKNRHLKTDNDKIFIECNGIPKNIEEFIVDIKNQFEIITNNEVKTLIQKYVASYIIDNKTNN